jgi:signal transduction histidine kinase/ligand-binding sensor domain-containing protein/CheY-like chemotaxis protein
MWPLAATSRGKDKLRMNVRVALVFVALLGAASLPLPAAEPVAATAEHDKTWAVVSGTVPDIRFDVLTRADGIPPEHFYQVLQDHRGFIWFTTKSGLVRYDGDGHVVYAGLPLTRIPPRTQAVPGLLFEDRKGTMWVATNVLTRFDPSTGKFMESINPRPGPARPGIDFITAIHDGPGGSLWLGVYSYSFDKIRPEDISDPVLYEVKPANAVTVAHRIPPSITQGRPVTIRAIEEDTRGRVWLGTSVGLVRFDPPTGTFRHYPHTHPDEKIWEQKQFNALVWDKTGHLWVHMPAGLERFDPETGKFDRFTAARFWYMFADPAGRIWTWGEFPGVKVFDPLAPADTALKTVFSISSSGQRLDEIVIVTLGPDRQGNVWAYPAAGSSAFRYSPGSAAFGRHAPEMNNPNSLSSGLVLGFSEDHDGAVSILDNSELNRFAPRSGKFTRFRHNPRDPHSITDLITSIYEDRSHTFWIGTEQGLMGSFDRNSGRYTPLRGANVNRSITSMFEDSSGRFWVGARFGPLYLVDRRTGEVTLMNIKGGYVTFEDRAGNLWFGAPPGVNRLDRAGNVRMIPLRQPEAANPAPTVVTSIYEDPGGLLWLASSRGVYQFDPRSEKVVSYGMREGLPTEDVRCMLPDDDGNLWVSTDQGISRFDRGERLFYNYDERDGLQSGEFTHFACYRARDGKLYFGGHSGFNAFFPREILARQPETTAALTAFQINGKDAPVLGIDSIRLNHRQNGLSFEFAVLNAENPGKLKYRFKLEGLEKRWIEVDSEHRLARYTELPPGEYVFRAEASSGGRSWAGKGAALRITILPPWWRTWWAQTLGALLLIGVLFGAYTLRVAALHRRRRQLEALVDQRTAELVEARDQAQAASKAKSVFLANMSHELRTPLNAILGFSKLLRGKNASHEQRDQLDIINRSGEHLLTLINNVLDVAKIEAGKQELTIAPCDLNALVRDVVEMMRVRAQTRNLELFCVPSPDFPRHVHADAPKLRQVLINLLGNAIKFTAEGKVALRLNATAPDDAGRLRLRFDVEDTGVGIPAEDHARIFEPFVQVGETGARQGTGLGLTITRQFVEMMGGSIGLESTPGQGSRFTVEVPVDVARGSDVAGGEPLIEHLFVLEPDQPEYRVLIVEDSQENATLLDQMLKRAGFLTRVAENGERGVEMFREWRPHFIWMDVRMPQMSGIEATRQIRALEGGRDVKIAAITASVFASERDQVLAAGMDDFVRKPYRPEEIIACMGRQLGVRYRQIEATASASAGDAQLRPEDLAALPSQLRRDLADAVVSLDPERIFAAIDRVGEVNRALAAVLRRLGDRFAFTAILNAIELSVPEAVRSTPDTSNDPRV